jgi:hypothetical protein
LVWNGSSFEVVPQRSSWTRVKRHFEKHWIFG